MRVVVEERKRNRGENRAKWKRKGRETVIQ